MTHDINIPIIIPSLYRKCHNTLHKCLKSIYRFYNPKNVIVVAQKYPDDEINLLKADFPCAEFIIKANGFEGKITEAFQFCHEYMSSKYSNYVFIEDDIIFSLCRGIYYPTLLVYEQLFNANPECGIIGCRHIGLQFGKPNNKNDIIKHVANPAHVIGYNSLATKNIVVDKNLTQFRVDTDITLQIIKQGFGFIFLNKLFAYNQLNPISSYSKEDKVFKLKTESDISTTSNRSIDIYKQHELYIANKYNLKINTKGRAMYEHFVKQNNIYIKNNPNVDCVFNFIDWSTL